MFWTDLGKEVCHSYRFSETPERTQRIARPPGDKEKFSASCLPKSTNLFFDTYSPVSYLCALFDLVFDVEECGELVEAHVMRYFTSSHNDVHEWVSFQ